MEFEQYKQLLESKEFKNWQKENKEDNFVKSDNSTAKLSMMTLKDNKKINDSKSSEDYLSHFYCQIDDSFKKKDSWEIGFYNPKDDKITTFVVGEIITIKPEEKVFKKQEKVDKLDLEKIKVDFETALEEFKKIKEEKYSSELILSGFVILQNWQSNTIWNISFATKSLKVLNIKINAENKKLVSDQLVNFMEQKASLNEKAS